MTDVLNHNAIKHCKIVHSRFSLQGYFLFLISFIRFKNLLYTFLSIQRFGCCSDGETAAEGPDEEGCEEKQDCNNFGDDKTYPGFGCCPDGKTFAQGPKNQGCFECPEEVVYFIIVIEFL